MVTEKDYVWPVIREILESVWGIVSQLLLGAALAIAVLFILVTLKWWSVPIFVIAAGILYVRHEIRIAYQADKIGHEDRITDRLNYLMRLSGYWDIETLEEKNEWYRKATADFIAHMEEYEKRYGKDDKYNAVYEDWMNIDKILRGMLLEETENE